MVFGVCAKEVCDKLTKVTNVKRRAKDRIVITVVADIVVNLLFNLSATNVVIDTFHPLLILNSIQISLLKINILDRFILCVGQRYIL